ncbi:LamG-like jellyroll fold domain-containing protein [Nocardioides zeicaulis]|uniref:LamG-like jellyroll fold domain-containing protein n=1 Tax=Nocardioides zeicaulis TaxID=1776857 RepID=A0ABV6DZ65_9ACTN
MRTSTRTPTTIPALVALALLAVGCGASGTTTGTRASVPQAPAPAVATAGAELWLSFDDVQAGFDGSPEYGDAQGGLITGRVVTANGGEVRDVAGGTGRGGAVAFPGTCTDATGCPRALVEVPTDPSLDPGDAPFSWGASVRLPPDETSAGSNVVQSGRYGSDGDQWKLQVDGEEGLPSCILRAEGEIVKIRSSTSVSDGAWHRVVCRRDADVLSIEVDGDVHRKPVVTGSVHTGLPVRIGSPGVGDHDDQFHGEIDDVVIDVDPRP